jgi:siroheme synthase-like protein
LRSSTPSFEEFTVGGMFKSLPIVLNADFVNAVIVGGGNVALRKALKLLERGVKVRIVCKEPCEKIEELANEGKVEVIKSEYQREHLLGANLVFACTDDADANARIAKDAQALGILVNVADNPKLCTFIMPAVLQKGMVTISVDTSAASPALSVILRDELNELIGEEYGLLAQLLFEMRDEIKKLLPEPSSRTSVVRKAMHKGLLKLLRNGDLDGAVNLLRQEIFKSLSSGMDSVAHDLVSQDE